MEAYTSKRLSLCVDWITVSQDSGEQAMIGEIRSEIVVA